MNDKTGRFFLVEPIKNESGKIFTQKLCPVLRINCKLYFRNQLQLKFQGRRDNYDNIVTVCIKYTFFIVST